MGSGAQSSASNPHPPSSGHPDDTLLVVGGYTDIDLLAHTPCVKSHNFVCVERSGGGKDGEIENDENLNALNAAFMTGGASSLKNKLKTGVHVLKMCGLTGALVHLSTNAIGPNVAFICASPVHKSLLYASTERIDDEGEIITMRLTPNFTLDVVHRTKAGGRSTCYLNFNKTNTHMMASHYWDAKISCFRVDDGTGMVGDAPRSVLSQPAAEAYLEHSKPTREEHWQYRQKWPHSHCVVTEPYHGLVHFVVDLGLDCVFAYRVDSKNGVLVKKGQVKLPKGKGPRHLVFHPTRRAAYLVNELDSTVSCFKVNIPEGWVRSLDVGGEEHLECHCETPGSILELTANLSSLPISEQGKTTISPEGVWKAKSHSSEIRVHPSGQFLVVGNRGDDSIAAFRVTDFAGHNGSGVNNSSEQAGETSLLASGNNSGGIQLVNITKSGGECPRNFNWAGGGRYLVVGNQNSSTVCVFGFDAQTGLVTTEPLFKSNVASPNYVFAQPFRDAVTCHGESGITVESSAMAVEHAVETPPRDVETAVAAIPA